MKKKKLSFVVPCYNSEKTIGFVLQEINEVISSNPLFKYEVIAIDDNSQDKTLKILKTIAKKTKVLKVLSLRKNSGKHCAMMAGLRHAKGEIIIEIDDDLQSPVPQLWELIRPIVNNECDFVTAKYIKTEQPIFKKTGSFLNFIMTCLLLEKPSRIKFENFSAMKPSLCKEIIKYTAPFPYFEGLVLNATDKIKCIPMNQRKRGDDTKSGFTLQKNLHLFLNGLTGFSVKPLHIASIVGILLSFTGFIFLIIILVNKVLNKGVPEGYTSIVAAIFLIGGMSMLLLGIIGEYIGRIYLCINNKPQYVIGEKINTR